MLSASLGIPSAGGRIVEVLGRSFLWVPLPNGGGPHSGPLDLPSLEIDGQAYVPVFSSEEQLRQVAGAHMAYTIAPAAEFARGLPPQVGIAVNPEGVVGIPLPPPAVAELCRAGRTPLDGPSSGGRVRLFEPDWQDDPVDFLAAASAEFAATGAYARAPLPGRRRDRRPGPVRRRRTDPLGGRRPHPAPGRPRPGPRQVPPEVPGQPGPPGSSPGPGLRLDAGEGQALLRPGLVDAGPGERPFGGAGL